MRLFLFPVFAMSCVSLSTRATEKNLPIWALHNQIDEPSRNPYT